LHDGDLEPGAAEKYYQVRDKIDEMLSFSHSGPSDWVWFVVEMLDWLQLRADDEDYSPDPASAWPHSFIIHDMVRAFATMAMFFPGLSVTELVTKFIESDQCDEFRNSLLFDPKQRATTLPDRRGRSSFKYRKAEFWKDWDEILKKPSYYADIYPFDWSLAIRPIIAQCKLANARLKQTANQTSTVYRAGVIAPAHYENDPQVVAGMATANTELHRPDKLDLFINYEDQYGTFPTRFPANYAGPNQWPALVPLAQDFANSHPNARFSLLRIWSAPHFYPLMVGLPSRQGISFLDSVGRVWEWKFVPKDMPGSEFSIHNAISRRLELFKEQFGKHVVSRGDLILVMAEDVEELLKTSTAVTFAIQTRPWFREIDLWKSLVDVDLQFLQDLDTFWLE
jgi:hypothetical protein